MTRLNTTTSPAGRQELHHVSFVLRCWRDGDGGIRLRLIDARSGVTYPLARLSELPGLLQGILERLIPAVRQSEIDAEEDKG